MPNPAGDLSGSRVFALRDLPADHGSDAKGELCRGEIGQHLDKIYRHHKGGGQGPPPGALTPTG